MYTQLCAAELSCIPQVFVRGAISVGACPQCAFCACSVKMRECELGHEMRNDLLNSVNVEIAFRLKIRLDVVTCDYCHRTASDERKDPQIVFNLEMFPTANMKWKIEGKTQHIHYVSTPIESEVLISNATTARPLGSAPTS